jgi:transposase-like protein
MTWVYTKEQKQEIIDRYRRGEKVHVIAHVFGCSPSYPALISKRKGVAIRRPRKRRAAS